MNLAVVKFYGKQYIVKPGTKILVNNFKKEVGAYIDFDQVLLVANSKILVGTPNVVGVKVKGKVVRKFTGPKLPIIKFKPKSRYLRRLGSRTNLAEIEILKIEPKGSKI